VSSHHAIQGDRRSALIEIKDTLLIIDGFLIAGVLRPHNSSRFFEPALTLTIKSVKVSAGIKF
jgi:hypothetical protein